MDFKEYKIAIYGAFIVNFTIFGYSKLYGRRTLWIAKKVGNLIQKLRKEKGLTQQQLANAMNISDKTISKWERALGCPDISLLPELSGILGVNIEKILLGDLSPNDKIGGNMKRINFYICPDCGNILTSTGGADISCCGRKLEALKAENVNYSHKLEITEIEDEPFITIRHDMTKDHYILFIAYATYDKILIKKLYPEQNVEVRMPKLHGGKYFFSCSKHGLFEQSDEITK